jgi:hypothetical protein
MKAITIRQPWAELILQGRKTIELRTWDTKRRGPVVVHAGKAVKQEACEEYGLDPATLPRGALVGYVDIVGVVEVNEGNWEELRDQHLALGDFPGERVGWRLANAERLPEPIPTKGRRQFFNVPDDLSGLPHVAASTKEVRAYPDKPFELRVVPRGGRDYALSLWQWPVKSNDSRRAEPDRLVELWGTQLRAVSDHVLEALRKGGHKVTDLSRARREPFQLDEETGLRLALLFLAVKPLTKLSRIEAISSQMRSMPSEEAYYWFSKCTATSTASRAQQAVRILLAEE